ncbi:MAG: hypothetical protein Q8905_17605, partial [Bacteroidota bacterium]|nr:hypothetical protein [Bacteroidota bacterium]
QLEYLFKNPLTDIELIKKRVETIKFFQDFSFGFIIDKDYFDFIEIYLKLQHIPVKLSAFDSFIKGIKYRIFPKNHYFIIQRGTLFLIKILNGIYKSFKEVDPASACVWVQNSRKEVLDMIDNSPLRIILKMKNRRRLSAIETRRLDYYFRKSYYNEIRKILETIYLFDALFSIAEAKKQLGFSLPELISEPDRFQAEMLFHPLLQEPVANDIIFDDLKHICFLTGPNMAGKSTFLKAIGISLYLAHAGFPVPASHLTTSVFNGLLTTINLPDNLDNGYSHFYNEVLRVKYVARQANEKEKIFVVFDEIFRGTNVKDAYEASLAVITAFARRKDSLLAVSTHILEV